MLFNIRTKLINLKLFDPKPVFFPKVIVGS